MLIIQHMIHMKYQDLFGFLGKITKAVKMFTLITSCEFLYSVFFLFSTNDPLVQSYLRNKFDFWNVHGLMNTSGLLQSSEVLGFSLILYVQVNRYGHFMDGQFT